MQAINRLLSQNCNCYPSIRCSTIKTKNTFFCSFKQKTGRVPKVRVLTDCESGRARRESAAEGSLFNLEGAGDEVCGKRR